MAKQAGSRPEIARWTADHVRKIVLDGGNTAPLIGPGDFARVSPDIDFWDAWPVQETDGRPARFDRGESLWMALGAPHRDDPEERHGLARIHLLQHSDAGWTHLGPVFPEGFTPGSREWSGSAVLGDDGRSLTVYFTAAGVRGERETSFFQRLFSARAELAGESSRYSIQGWHDLQECVGRDPAWFMASDAGQGRTGTIKAFRDPAYFRDPQSGQHHLFFAGSLAGSASVFNGAIGVATSDDAQRWTTLPPLLTADGLNNELERPHVVMHGGLYYLFWSTQAHVFDPVGPGGPTGLYGVVSARLDGAWEPLNGSGLVLANPPQAPQQAYSWLVVPDLTVISFVDNWGQGPGARPKRFGATFAPLLKIELEDSRAQLAR